MVNLISCYPHQTAMLDDGGSNKRLREKNDNEKGAGREAATAGSVACLSSN